ncbi:MAG: pantoate--beta-alanine ligase [Peptococcaceae bacterium]|nr:pantoate--beta-alanine ligase [Peptococcaceae bacterium]
MKICQTIASIRDFVRSVRNKGPVGLVPTMGYFHEGHLALMRRARQECTTVVVSIFVNPIQFGPSEDYETYPRNTERDLHLAREAGVDAVFIPGAAEMYPEGYATYVDVERLTDKLCGRSRPGHFRGVATVVTKLFNIVNPDIAYFGEKDAQQLQVIRKMVRDLNMPVKVVGIPTVREPDGLAMSSRNTYLSPGERRAATVLYRALQQVCRAVAKGERDPVYLQQMMKEIINQEPLVQLEYAEIYQLPDLEPLSVLKGDVLVAVAARCGRARLIDNVRLNMESLGEK